MKTGSLFVTTVCVIGVAAALATAAIALDPNTQPTAAPSGRRGDEQVTERTEAATPSPPPVRHERWLPPIGVNISSYVPFHSNTRSAFGGQWIDFGPGIGAGPPDHDSEFEPSVSSLSRNHKGNKLLILQAGAEYVMVLGRRAVHRNGRHLSVVPYAGLEGYITYAKLNTAVDTGRSTHWVPCGAVVAGVGFGRSFYVEARARFFPKMNGYDFSGSELEAALRF